MNELLPLLSAALVAGLVGSAHCLGMCAGISGLFAVKAEAASMRASVPTAFVYNAGRVITYAVLGAIVAAFGSVIIKASPNLAVSIRMLSGIIIILVGLQVAFNLRALRVIERMGGTLWAKIAPAAQKLLPIDSLPKAFGLGLIWGWLPCGLVYSVLMIAATSANPVGGAATMVAFGIGTMPAMMLSGLGAARLGVFMQRRGARVGFGLLVVAMGLLTIAMPVSKIVATTASHSM